LYLVSLKHLFNPGVVFYRVIANGYRPGCIGTNAVHEMLAKQIDKPIKKEMAIMITH